MDAKQRREGLHRVSVAGNTAAGVAGAGFGAAKLRDEFRHQYPKHFDRSVANAANTAIKRGVKPPHISEGVRIAQKAKPGFKTLAIGSAAGALGAGARELGQHMDRKAKKSGLSKLFEGEIAKADDKPAADRSLSERFRQARKPPPVKTERVSSTAVRSLGYQKQTRRLAVEMHSRPGEPYVYRVSPKTARKVTDAPSKGQAYTQVIRGKAPRAGKAKARDRARLFAQPVSKRMSAFGVQL